jgi:hypothetical protein
MISRVLYIILIFIPIASCNNRVDYVMPDSYVSKYSANQLAEKLNNFYQSNSQDSLMGLFMEWEKIVPFSSNEYIDQNDTIKNLYLIFADLYQPFKFGDYNAVNMFNGSNKFIVIQNEIKYAVISKKDYKQLVYNSTDIYPNDTAYEFYRNTKILPNFRPPVKSISEKYLFLTKEYKQAINDFLHLGTFQGDIILNNTIFNRYKFLSPTLPIVYGHWGGYWHIETFPIIERVLFESGFKHASVDFRYSLEETVLQYRISKKSDHWIADNKWLKIRLE